MPVTSSPTAVATQGVCEPDDAVISEFQEPIYDLSCDQPRAVSSYARDNIADPVRRAVIRFLL